MLSATVLIPAHNEDGLIGGLVRACLDQSYPIEEVIVVADGRTDATAEQARQAGALRARGRLSGQGDGAERRPREDHERRRETASS